jgi:hypothetical protein
MTDDTKRDLPERLTILDAPSHYTSEQASAWSTGARAAQAMSRECRMLTDDEILDCILAVLGHTRQGVVRFCNSQVCRKEPLNSEDRAMNLYKISQTQNENYDTYDSAVVCAESLDAAKEINPSGKWGEGGGNILTRWCKAPEDVCVEYIGIARDGLTVGIVLSSFNAG